MSRAFVNEDAGGRDAPLRRFVLPDRDDPAYDEAAALALLEGAAEGDTESAEVATGYYWGDPTLRAEIEQIRGVETSGVLRTLLERKLVRIVGRKEEPGRPIMYGTTKFFLEHFGLRDLSQLPPLREFKELGESEQVALPMDEEQGLEETQAMLRIDESEERTDDGEVISADSERTECVLEESVHPG